MKISELSANKSVCIESTKDGAFLTFDTTICEFTDPDDLNVVNRMKENYKKIDFCFINGVHEEEYLIDFTSPIVRNDLVVVIDEKPWAWKNVRIMNLTLPNYGRVHVAMTTSGELPHNRRGSFRLEVDRPCTYNFVGESDKMEGVVRDLSSTGIGFVATNINGIHEESLLQIQFSYGQSFYLTCKVCRIKDLGRNRFLIGCEFPKPSEAIASFIAAKQREKNKNKMKRF